MFQPLLHETGGRAPCGDTDGVADDGETDPLVVDAGPEIPVPVAPEDADAGISLTALLQLGSAAGADDNRPPDDREADSDISDMHAAGATKDVIIDPCGPGLIKIADQRFGSIKAVGCMLPVTGTVNNLIID